LQFSGINMKYRFYTCDVFTDTRFGGNPLAVLPNAQGLSDTDMQQIAREFNYSETTFVFPAKKGHTRHVRIFTPGKEIPFAGHPNIGTAFILASTGELGNINKKKEITFEEKAGLVAISIRQTAKNIWCELKAPEMLSIGQTIQMDLVASALSLSLEEIITDTHPPQIASVGLPFIMVQLKNRAALENIRLNFPAFEEINMSGITADIHVYTLVNDEYNIRTRMFAPLDGIPEDPATGSANCALVAMLSHYRSEPDGNFNWRIAQGIEMQRPSILDARTQKQNGAVTGVWIAGNSSTVSEGFIEI
jgi:trans-2,3-dihydro-3-hydroxyanthranilate isomerase